MPLPIWPAPITPTLRMEGTVPPLWSPRVFGRSFTSTIFAYPFCGAGLLRSATALFKLFFKFLGQLRQGLIEVCHQHIIGDLKDRCFIILVDSDDDFRILHSGEMLNST